MSAYNFMHNISRLTYAFFIVRRQREQTAMDLVLPPTEIFTLRMLGFQHLFVLRWEWETFSPNTTPLPQILHFAILDTSLGGYIDLILNNGYYYITSVLKLQAFF
jgi:hypothetical protein